MKLKKVLAFLLAGCMAVSLVPSALASDDEIEVPQSLKSYDSYVPTSRVEYDANGQAVTTKYSYNSHGDLASMDYTSGLVRYFEYEYDKLGNATKIRKIRLNEDDGELNYTYNGRILTSAVSSDGSKTTYAYTDDTETITFYDKDGKLSAKTENTYQNDYLVSSVMTNADGSVDSKENITYDKDGNVSTDTWTFIVENGLERVESHTYTYDEYGYEIKDEFVCTLDGAKLDELSYTATTAYTSDENDRVASSIKTSTQDESQQFTYTYNENGTVASIYEKHNDAPVCYKTFDEHGNLTGDYDSFDSSNNVVKNKECKTYEYAKLADLIGDSLKDSFTDTQTNVWYSTPVLWAVSNGITNGMGDNKFQPNTGCTRGQIVTMLWRMAGEPEPTSAATQFTDVKSDAYYGKAVAWAVENKITDGMGDGKFQPNTTCTRAQTVTFIWRAYGEPETISTTTKFTDVNLNSYYGKAVLWAVDNAITNGVNEENTLFAPNMTCTRGHIATFLYRAFAE